MQLKMSENSLFAVLLRSPWWISFGLAIAIGAGTYAIFPKDMASLAPFVGLPFIVTGCIAAWRWRLYLIDRRLIMSPALRVALSIAVIWLP